jgi:hypothetical protein
VKHPLSPRALVCAGLVVAGFACGDVPTLPDGIAYISTVILPSPAVAIGDTLRDSTGKATPIHVFGIGQNGDTITSVAPRYVITSVPGKSVHLSAGDFVIGDSVRTAQIVGQIGSRLQTPPVPLDVVQQPDAIAPTTATTSKFLDLVSGEAFNLSEALGVTVTSGAGATRAGVRSIIVHFAVSKLFPATATFPDTTLVLLDDSNRFVSPDGRVSVDTTDASGNASRKLRALLFGSGADSVEVTASATNLRGVPLSGSPIRFIVTSK